MSCDGRVWVTRMGEEITYHDLTDRHLINIIRFCRRGLEYAHADAAMMSGEVAAEWMDDEIARMVDQLDELTAEAERRGLGG